MEESKLAVLITRIILIMAIMTTLPANAETLAAGETLMETMIVTASKREASATEIPASISVQDAIFIENQGIENTEEMTRFVPNLYYKKATSGDAFISRGISTIDTSLFSPMGFYVNDVPQALSFMQDCNLFDVERVEVLRGP